MSIINSQPRIGAAGQSTGFKIERSLRFNSADSAYLNRTPASAGNRKTWTFSAWVKRSALSSYQALLSCYSASTDTGNFEIAFGSGDKLIVLGWNTVFRETNAVFRDPSAWYHIVVTMDTTLATGANRLRVYINGTEQTYSSSSDPTQNTDYGINQATTTRIGSVSNTVTSLFNGFQTEVNFIDGQALTPSSFGETNADTGVWKPKAYSGSYGTNGFYLKFADNSGTTSTTLGKDSSGNGNNWTPNNFSVTAGSGNDSLVDTPTPYGTDTGAGGSVRGNYCTLNPLSKGSTVNIANGNLDVSNSTSGGAGKILGTIGVSSGKWYAEVTVSGGGGMPGISEFTANLSQYPGGDAQSWGYNAGGDKYHAGSNAAYGASFTTNDVIGIALDMDAGSITFYKNNVSQGVAYSTGIAGKTITFAGRGDTSTTESWNFGQRPFAYTAPSGFKALCTQNLPTPTIGATSATQANKYFDVVLRTSNGNVGGTYSTTVNMSNGALMWDKGRSINSSHYLLDSVRGISKTLSSDTTGAEANYPNWFTNFGSSSFTTGSDDYTAGTTVVDWIWAANGSGSSNTAGSITSTVSANTTAGFSIVTYTGNGTSGATVGHGCLVNGAATTPSMVILKRRDAVSNWQVKHVSLNANQNLELNSTAAVDTAPGSGYISAISSTTLTLLNGGSAITNVNANTGTYLAYCFSEVAGYSKFGSYTGNGSTDGPFVFTGFRPAWVLVKPSSTTGDWLLYDNKRNSYNVVNNILYPNASSAEATSGGGATLDFVSNGFKLRGAGAGFNDSGTTFVYACFAEVPTKFALAR